MYTVLQALVVMVAIKAIIGYRFPWETCQCCGQKIRDHRPTQ